MKGYTRERRGKPAIVTLLNRRAFNAVWSKSAAIDFLSTIAHILRIGR